MQENQAQFAERLSFNEAVAFVQQTGKAAFAAMPVFGDNEDDENATAEGARVFLLLPDEDEGWSLRFIAGPFFTSAYAANDVISSEEIPDRVRELLFMPTRCEDDWLTDQLQVLLGKLTQAAGIAILFAIRKYLMTDSDDMTPHHPQKKDCSSETR